MPKRNNGTDLTNELIYQKYLMNHGQLRQYFRELNMPEYLALHMIEKASSADAPSAGKTYLKDLAEEMQLSIRQTSKMIAELRDRGLVNWAHDGDGAEGTYVIITETGAGLIHRQEETLKDYYGRVIEKYGKDNMIRLLEMMNELETVMNDELGETEADADENESLF